MILKNYFHTLIGSFFILLVLFVGAFVPFSSATCPPGTDYLPGKSSGVCIPDSDAVGLSKDTPLDVIVKVVEFLLGFVGALAILMIIVGGIYYITSGGDESRIDTAKRILMWAIGGLIVVLLGWVIVTSVIDALNGPSSILVGGSTNTNNPAYTLPTTVGQ